MMLQVLAQLYHLTSKASTQRERAEGITNAFSGTIRQRLLGFSSLLNGMEALREAIQIVVIGEADAADTAALKRVIYGVSQPGRVLRNRHCAGNRASSWPSSFRQNLARPSSHGIRLPEAPSARCQSLVPRRWRRPCAGRDTFPAFRAGGLYRRFARRRLTIIAEPSYAPSKTREIRPELRAARAGLSRVRLDRRRSRLPRNSRRLRRSRLCDARHRRHLFQFQGSGTSRRQMPNQIMGIG